MTSGAIETRAAVLETGNLNRIFEDGYLKGPGLNKFFDDLTVQMRDVLKETGAKVIR